MCTIGLICKHRFPCYDNIAPNVKCQRVLVLAVCLVIISESEKLILILLSTWGGRSLNICSSIGWKTE